MASSPASHGSSATYSKLRPHSGERFMLMPGPSTTDTPQARASRASAWPTSLNRLGFQELPRADAVGKQVAGTLPDRPTWSASVELGAQPVRTVGDHDRLEADPLDRRRCARSRSPA